MANPITHKVISGDTLFSLSKKYGLTINELKSINNLTSDTIKVGQILKLTPFTHTVVSGDTLYNLAKKYNTTVDTLKSINGLTSNTIKLGQILKLQFEPNTPQPNPQINKKNAIIFFIGGAGDKKTFYLTPRNKNMEYVYDEFTSIKNNDLSNFNGRIFSTYLGYDDVKGSSDIATKVVAQIPNKSDLIYIVGHSLGGWNGAHLTSELKNQGYDVEILITLDPVGEGVIVGTFTDIPYKTPKVEAKQWINIYSDPDNETIPDKVANFGEQWQPKTGTTYNITTKIHHENALGMMYVDVIPQKTVMDLFIQSIKDNLK